MQEREEIERATCPIDQGSLREQEFNEDSVNAVRALVPEPKDQLTEEDLECELCSGPIEEKRAALGYTLCVDCSRWQEKANKQRRVYRGVEE